MFLVNDGNARWRYRLAWHCTMTGLRTPSTAAIARELFHGWGAEVEPLLHEVNAQQYLYSKRGRPLRPSGVEGATNPRISLPGKACCISLRNSRVRTFLGGKVQTATESLHGLGCCRTRHACANTYIADLCRGPLRIFPRRLNKETDYQHCMQIAGG